MSIAVLSGYVSRAPAVMYISAWTTIAVLTARSVVYIACAVASPIVKSYAHTAMMCAGECPAMIPRASAVHVPCVSATVCNVEMRTAEIEEIMVRIVCEDAEMPASAAPVYRTVEILQTAECTVLPVEKYVREVKIATAPILGVNVIGGRY